MKGICKLCQKEAQLELSHILPKFIYKWINKTSGTGKMRGLSNPNVALQDGYKIHLLCPVCEDKFSKYETWFASNFFHPSIKGVKISYPYNENLFKFAASIFWRYTVTNMNREDYNQTRLKPLLLLCEEELRDFLKNDVYPQNFNSIYIGVTSYAINPPKELRGINNYFTRFTDSQIIFNDSETKMYYYCVIPYFLFVGNITGLRDSDFINSKISPTGGDFKTTTMEMRDPDVGNLIISQIKRLSNIRLSSNQLAQIDKKVLDNIDKYMNSKSFEAEFLEDLMLGTSDE